MSDIVENAQGEVSPIHIGGPAMYALAGIRMWTKNCKLVAQAGEDYRNTYGRWMDDNGLTHESILVELEKCTCHTLRYDRQDGGFNYVSNSGSEFLGYLKTHPYHIDTAATSDVRGIYMAQNLDRIVWKKLDTVKSKYDFKIMWEIEYGNDTIPLSERLQKIKDVLFYTDMWSINNNEASDLFQIPREKDEDIINEIMKLNVEFTLYRVGKRGAYAVTPTEAYFCPSVDPFGESVDPTGCGNCSTGAALYAYTEFGNPLLAVIMANISSGYNAAQYGPYPVITDEVMENVKQMAEQLYKQQNKNSRR